MVKAIRIKQLCLANGDEYENVELDLSVLELKQAIREGGFIIIKVSGKEVWLNTEFIISFELRESRELSAI